MTHEFDHPIIGQEAICPDGLGRVIAFKNDFPHQWIQVSTYVNDRQCKWDMANVELIDPRKLTNKLRWLVRRNEVTAEEVRTYRDAQGITLAEAKAALVNEKPRVLQQWSEFEGNGEWVNVEVVTLPSGSKLNAVTEPVN